MDVHVDSMAAMTLDLLHYWFFFYGSHQLFQLKEHHHILKLRPTFYYNACDTYKLDDAGHQ
jgi:hypothetical protein